MIVVKYIGIIIFIGYLIYVFVTEQVWEERYEIALIIFLLLLLLTCNIDVKGDTDRYIEDVTVLLEEVKDIDKALSHNSNNKINIEYDVENLTDDIVKITIESSSKEPFGFLKKSQKRNLYYNKSECKVRNMDIDEKIHERY